MTSPDVDPDIQNMNSKDGFKYGPKDWKLTEPTIIVSMETQHIIESIPLINNKISSPTDLMYTRKIFIYSI